eukprot:COSAG02_NODE_5497_length_4280_cov_7.072232_5_plen_47_part_00
MARRCARTRSHDFPTPALDVHTLAVSREVLLVVLRVRGARADENGA